MSDVLSQNEIDDLLSALSTGEVDVSEIEEEAQEKKVRKYDFSRPDKFAKDQLRTLEIIHENFSRLLNNFLSGYLRTFVEIEVLSVQSLIYNEFSNSVSNPAILGIVDFQPLDGEVIIDVSPDIGFAMIERVLGSSKAGVHKEQRTLTEIELTLLKTILMRFINLLKEPWENIVELHPKLKNIETNSQFAQIVSPSESIALITFKMKISDVENMINLCIPHFVIEPILPRLTSKLWFSKSHKKDSTEEERRALHEHVHSSDVLLRTIVGKTKISVSEFLGLQRGDIILLDKRTDEDFDVYVDQSLQFKARPGSKKNRVAVKITKSLMEGDE